MDTPGGSNNHLLGFYDKDRPAAGHSPAQACSASLAGVEPCCLRVGCATEIQLSLRVENFEPDGLSVPVCVRILVQDNVLVEQICDVEAGRKLLVVRLWAPALPQGQARLLVTKRNCTGRVHVSYPLLVLPTNACNEMKQVQLSMLQRYKRQGVDMEWACCKLLDKHFIPFLEDFASVQLLCGPPSTSQAVRLPPAKVLEMSCRVLTFLRGNTMWECLVSLLLLSDKHKDSQIHENLQAVGIPFQQLLEKISDTSFNQMFISSSSSSDKSTSSSDTSSLPASPQAASPRSPHCRSHSPSPPPPPATPPSHPNDTLVNQELPAWIVAYLAALKGQFSSSHQEQAYHTTYQRRWFAGVDTAMAAFYLLSGMLLLLAGPVTTTSLVSATVQLLVCMLRMLLYVGTKDRPLYVRHASLFAVMLVIVLSGRGSALLPSGFSALLPQVGGFPPFQVPVLHQLGLSLMVGLLPGSTLSSSWTPLTLTLSVAITLLQEFLMRLHFLASQHAKQV